MVQVRVKPQELNERQIIPLKSWKRKCLCAHLCVCVSEACLAESQERRDDGCMIVTP